MLVLVLAALLLLPRSTIIVMATTATTRAMEGNCDCNNDDDGITIMDRKTIMVARCDGTILRTRNDLSRGGSWRKDGKGAKPPGSSPLTVADRPYSNNGSGVPGSRPPLNRCFFNDPPRPPRLPDACTSSHNPSPKLGWAAFLFPLWNCFHLLIPLIELIPLFTN